MYAVWREGGELAASLAIAAAASAVAAILVVDSSSSSRQSDRNKVFQKAGR